MYTSYRLMAQLNLADIEAICISSEPCLHTTKTEMKHLHRKFVRFRRNETIGSTWVTRSLVADGQNNFGTGLIFHTFPIMVIN